MKGGQAPLVLLLVDLTAGEPLGEQLLGRGPGGGVGVRVCGCSPVRPRARNSRTAAVMISAQNRIMLADIANQPQPLTSWSNQNIIASRLPRPGRSGYQVRSGG
uniref:Uncharacterized protein n=2 Tax=unclassified Streptomyces TaxID=2593676 RepID=V9Z5M9_9ACTN|nr:hypothetical protein pFRL3_147c [Streptomyces sp. FR1]AHE39408.1 hypothetical protein pFRL4_175c [Streptomyces sp. F2]